MTGDCWCPRARRCVLLDGTLSPARPRARFAVSNRRVRQLSSNCPPNGRFRCPPNGRCRCPPNGRCRDAVDRHGGSGAGRYGDVSGLTSPLCAGNCTAGYYCGTGSSSAVAVICPAGKFSPSGSSVCSLCDPGRFGSSDGMTASSCSGPCTAGFYCPSGSAIATAVVCPAGYFWCVSTKCCFWRRCFGRATVGYCCGCGCRVAPGDCVLVREWLLARPCTLVDSIVASCAVGVSILCVTVHRVRTTVPQTFVRLASTRQQAAARAVPVMPATTARRQGCRPAAAAGTAPRGTTAPVIPRQQRR